MFSMPFRTSSRFKLLAAPEEWIHLRESREQVEANRLLSNV